MKNERPRCPYCNSVRLKFHSCIRRAGIHFNFSTGGKHRVTVQYSCQKCGQYSPAVISEPLNIEFFTDSDMNTMREKALQMFYEKAKNEKGKEKQNG